MQNTGHAILPLLLVTAAACGSKQIETAPESIVVVVGKGLEPSFDAMVTDRLKQRLGEAGFVVVPPDAPAALRVSFEGELQRKRDGLAPSSALVGATLSLVATGPDGATNTATLRFEREVVRPLDVAELERKWAVEELATQTIAWLVHLPSVMTRIDFLQQRRGSSALFATRPLADVRLEHARSWTQSCQAERERLALLDADSGAKCVGDPCGNWMLAGVAPDGALLVVDRTQQPLFELSSDASPSWAATSERLLRVPASGDGQPVELWSSHAIRDVYLPADRARTMIVAATSGDRWGTVMLDVMAGGVLAPPTILRDDVSFQGAVVLPGGDVVTLQDRAFLMGSGARLEGMRMVWVVGDGLVGQDAYGMLVRFDAKGNQLGTVPFETAIDGIIGAPDGSVYALQHQGEACSILGLAKDSLALSWTVDLETCISHVTMLADGRLAASADGSTGRDTPGDTEVVVVEPTTGRMNVLTRDGFDVARLYAGGSRVAFSRDLVSGASDFRLGTSRQSVCWLDVPPRIGPVPPPPSPPAPDEEAETVKP